MWTFRRLDPYASIVFFFGAMSVLLARPAACGLAVMLCCAAMLTGCPEDPPVVEGLKGTEGRNRYVVTMTAPAPDLDGYRAAAAASPDDAAAFVAKQRAALAAAQTSLDQVVAGLGGRVVNRWWMSGQATIEVSPAAIASIKALPGVTSVEPDRPLE